MNGLGKPLRRLLARPPLQISALLAFALVSVALSASAHIRGAEPRLLIQMALLGGAVAWLAAEAAFSSGVAALLVLVSGWTFSILQVGRLASPVWIVMKAALRTYWRWLLNPLHPEASLHLTLLAAIVKEFGAQLAALAARLGEWVQGFLVGSPAYDPVGAALMWSTLIWCLAAWAAWQLHRRSRPLIALLPLLALSAYTSFYSGGSASGLLVPLATLLMLLALDHHHQRQRRWNSQGLVRAKGLTNRLAWTVVPLTIGLVIIAAVAPSLSYERAVRWAQRVAGPRSAPESTLGNSIGLQRSPSHESPFYSASTPGLPNRHLVGSDEELSEQIAMNVSVFNLPVSDPPPRFYWRGLTYDRYTGYGWVTSPTVSWSYAPGESTAITPPVQHRLVKQKVRLAEQATPYTFHTGQLNTLDREYDVAWRTEGKDPFAASLEAQQYEVHSLISSPTAAQLRAANGDYPQWVSERYLRLPQDVPNRVTALARDLTVTAPTRYDRAQAIVEHLREIEYDLDVPLPPDDRDVVDWFLFDLQRGYCDYYASAMVVLARAAGLPARFVVGYYTGEAAQTEGTYQYVVSAADAHSWVEVYFPGYGWVEFDPTAGRPPIDRSRHPVDLQAKGPTFPEPTARGRPPLTRVANTAAQVAGTLLAVAFPSAAMIPFVDLWDLRRRRAREAIGVLYARLDRLASRLGLNEIAVPTPHELGRSLAFWAAASVRGGRVATLAPSPKEIETFIDLSVRSAYSRRPLGPDEVLDAWRRWWSLALRLGLAVTMERLWAVIRALSPKRLNSADRPNHTR